MSIGFVSSIIRDGVFLVLKICAPILGAALIIGLIIQNYCKNFRVMLY